MISSALDPIVCICEPNIFCFSFLYVFRDAMIVPIINCGTSIFAGFVIFSVLGFMAHTAGTTVDEVVKQGDYGIFIVSILSRFISLK